MDRRSHSRVAGRQPRLRRLAPLLCLVGLSACGLPDPLEVIEPVHGCLGPFNGPVDGHAVQANEEIAKQILVREHVVRSSKRFCEEFGGIPITVLDTDEFRCPSPTGWCLGRYDTWGIKLTRDARSLVHELFHAHELEHFTFDTGNHPNWDAKGYYRMADEYAAKAAPIYVLPDGGYPTSSGFVYSDGGT